MSQTNPPGPNNPYGEPQDEPSPGREQSTASPDSGAYYGQHEAAAAPDLDANAPQLKSNELQRLNRKALLFLAGILALLVVLIVWMLNRATSDDRPQPRPREESVVVPELPRGTTNAPTPITYAPEPISVEPYAQPELPPLPPAEAPDSYGPGYAAGPAPRGPSLMERRMLNMAESGTAAAQSPQNDPFMQAMLAGLPGTTAADAPEAQSSRAAATSARFISRPDTLLVRGTYIRCVLETRIVTDVDGFTSCIVTEPTYSINGRNLLLPKGSKLLGRYTSRAVAGERVAVIWDRVTTPNGYDVTMASPGIDNLGGAGHPGDRNAHWGSRITSALLISLISDAFKYAGEKNGPTSTTTYGNGFVVEQPFESNTARTVQRLAEQALEESAGRPATITINQGTVVAVYVSQDIDFSGVLARQ